MRSLPRPTGRTLTLWILGVALLLVAVALGNQDLVWPGLFLLLLPLIALVSVLVRPPRFTVRRRLTPPLAEAGEPLEVLVQVTTQRPSPLTAVFAEDAPDAELGRGVPFRLAATRVGEVTEVGYTLHPRRRGRFVLRGFAYRFTDFLGLWVHTVRSAAATPVVVRPAMTWLPGGAAQSYGITGETPIPQTAIAGPDDVLVREYQPRDDVRRIHWPSTARAGTLMVRREEAAWDPTAWVVLDSRAGVHPVAGKVSPSFEALVSAAASIGTRLVRDGYAVGLVDAEGASHHVAADRPDGEDSWLDPLIDVALTGAPDLLEAGFQREGGRLQRARLRDGGEMERQKARVMGRGRRGDGARLAGRRQDEAQRGQRVAGVEPGRTSAGARSRRGVVRRSGDQADQGAVVRGRAIRDRTRGGPPQRQQAHRERLGEDERLPARQR